MNRLADETSPYLRQHRDNPVDWYPWGEDAFEAARAEDKPVLLSVGYSACHWCHVMAHESFENPATAAVMNELFVNIKVDREERPDVDAIYMEAVQAITGHGGWPMTVFLTPDAEPFFGGTYYPDEARHGMPAFVEVLHKVREIWDTRRDDLLAQAEELTESIRRSATMAADLAVPGPEILDQAVRELRTQYDAAYGGFGGAPKFPQSMSHEVLLRAFARTGDDDTLHMVTNSLDAMASGGIYDHLGGGFSRYSVDARWVVPHFEKMLYDNALLTRLFLHAWQLTRKRRYGQVLIETIGYVLRDLRHAEGGFYSAEDADSEGEEGKFYVWSLDQIRAVLGDDAEEFATWFGVTPEGNFEGRNILNRPVRGQLERSAGIELSRQRLFAARELRVRPGLDDKILTEWNALMLSALAEAAAATGNRQWRQAAVRNGEFLCANLRRADGRWLRSWQAGDEHTPAQARHLAYAHDHAALVDAFVRLYEATGEARWVSEARTTADSLIELFWDDARGGVFTTGSDAEALVTRPKDLLDNATPSANSMTAVALLRLGALTGERHYRERAENVLRLLGRVAGRHPTSFGHLLCALEMYHTGMTEIVVTGDRQDLVEAAQSRFLPHTVLAWGEPFPSGLWQGRTGAGTDGLAYVCENHVCHQPVADEESLLARLLGRSV